MTKFLSVYDVTRHYGGPEEGGWWYNWYAPVETVPVEEDDLAAVKSYLQTKYDDRPSGDIYSVLGGVAVSIMVEDEPFEHRTTERPFYS